MTLSHDMWLSQACVYQVRCVISYRLPDCTVNKSLSILQDFTYVCCSLKKTSLAQNRIYYLGDFPSAVTYSCFIYSNTDATHLLRGRNFFSEQTIFRFYLKWTDTETYPKNMRAILWRTLFKWVIMTFDFMVYLLCVSLPTELSHFFVHS